VIVGAGPAGLSAAIRVKQMAEESGQEVSVCVLEKGSEVGAHILSGAVIDPVGINRLFPDWKERGAPLETPVTSDRFLVLGPAGALPLPNFMLPPLMKNHGNYIASLGNVARWLGEQAEAMGVEIYPGFAAAELLFDENGAVRGVATGDMGVSKPARKKTAGCRAWNYMRNTHFWPKVCAGHCPRRPSPNTTLMPTATFRSLVSGLRNCGRLRRKTINPAMCNIHWAGRSTIRQAAVLGSITLATISSQSVLSCI